MDILCSLPSFIEEAVKEKVIYALPYDITQTGGTGYVVCTKSKLYSFDSDSCILSLDMKSIEEFNYKNLCTSVIFECKCNNGVHIAACATPKHANKYGELAKVLNHYLKTDEVIEDATIEDDITKNIPYYRKYMFNEKSKYGLSIYKRLYSLVKPYKGLIVLAILFATLNEAVAIINPYITRILADDFLTNASGSFKRYSVYILIMALLVIISVVFQVLNGKFANLAASSFAKDLRSLTYNKIQALSMKDISKRTAGELINRVTGDTIKVQNFVTDDVTQAFIRGFSFIVLSVVLFSTNWKLALLVFLPVPVLLIATYNIRDVMGKMFWRSWRKWCKTNSLLHDILSGMRIVKSYGNEKLESEKYTSASKEWADAMYAAEKYWASIMPVLSFVITSGEFLVLYFGGKMVLSQALTIGQLVQYTAYVAMIYGPMRWVVMLPRRFSEAAVSTQKLFEIIDEKTDVTDIENAEQIDIKGEIKFNNVDFGYKPYSLVLNDVSLTINQGEMVGIVGHSGVGKSTLINLVMRLYDVNSGSVEIDGHNVKNISQHSLRSQIGVVLQETFLFDGSVLDNIRYAMPEATYEQVIKAAKVANAHEFICRLPDGYNTRVGERGYGLSGGERQRVAIARAILHDPKIIILDEATASLDTITEKQIQQALQRLTKGRTTLAIAHRLSTLRNADRLVVLNKGKLAEMGSHEQLMQQKGIYYDLVMAQRVTNKMAK